MLAVWAWEPDLPPTGERYGTPAEDGFWIGTFNVNYEFIDGSTAAALAAAPAQLWFLQETHDAWRPLLPDAVHDAWLERADEGGMTVLSELPVVWQASEPAGAHFAGACATVTHPQGEVRVLHLHLLPPLSEDGGLLEGYFSTGPARLAELQAHLLACPAPDVVLGDLNEGDGASTQHLLALGFVDSQQALGARDSTWSWDTGWLTLRGRPDHIFVGPRLEVLASQVHLERGASDHHPLRAQVRWR